MKKISIACMLALMVCWGCTSFKMGTGSINITDDESGLSVNSEVKDVEMTGDVKINESQEAENDGSTDTTGG